MSVAITPQLIEKLVAYLNQPDDAGRVWSGLLFMEEKGLDPSLRSDELAGYLHDPRSSPLPDPERVTDEDLREIALALRDRARADAGLPPLSPDERTSWTFAMRRVPAARLRGRQMKMSGESPGGGLDVSAIEKELLGRDPELLRAVRVFASASGPLSKENQETRQSYVWFMNLLAGLVMEAHPEIGGVDALELAKMITQKYEVSSAGE